MTPLSFEASAVNVDLKEYSSGNSSRAAPRLIGPSLGFGFQTEPSGLTIRLMLTLYLPGIAPGFVLPSTHLDWRTYFPEPSLIALAPCPASAPTGVNVTTASVSGWCPQSQGTCPDTRACHPRFRPSEPAT